MIPILTAVLSTLTPQGGELTHEQFRVLHRDLVPTWREPWQMVPWRLDLLAARAEAADKGRLLFLWSMNGHPLGCT